MRNGVRIGDLNDWPYFESKLRGLVSQLQRSYPELVVDVDAELAYYQSIRAQICSLTLDTVVFANEALRRGENILVEGANATMLDLDFGTYPFVTSSNPSVGSTATGLGVAPNKFGDVNGIVKAYCTRCVRLVS
jgi:adenylosuccinate synthase